MGPLARSVACENVVVTASEGRSEDSVPSVRPTPLLQHLLPERTDGRMEGWAGRQHYRLWQRVNFTGDSAGGAVITH